MKKFDWKRVFPHIAAIIIFLIVAAIYCKPALEGLQLQQSDVTHWKGMAQNSFDYKEKHGHFPLWSNGMFSGMPAYQIAMESDHSFSIGYFQTILTLGLPKPINFFFLACICFYILMVVVRVNPWIGILGAISYAYSTYDPVIIATGHDTKMLAIAYAPGVIAGLILLYRKQYLLGIIVMSVMLGLQVGSSHIQIVYYTMLTGFALTIALIIDAVKKKEFKHLFISTGIAALIALTSLGATAVTTLTTAEYAKYSNRGGETPLTPAGENATKGGLDKEYAFRWSYGISETMTLFSAGVYGGSNGGKEYKTSEFANKLQEVGYPEETGLQYANGSSYWGSQPFTSGPVYLGAIVCALFISAFFFTKSWHRWWILGAVIFAIALAWGRHFQAFNYFLFDHLPLYKKFRAPAVSLVIPQLCFPLLGCIGLHEILFGNETAEWKFKQFKKAAIAVAILSGLLLIMYFSATYSAPADTKMASDFASMMIQQSAPNGQPTLAVQEQAATFGKSFVTALQADRKSLFSSDMIKTILLCGVFFALVLFYLKKKISASIVIFSILILTAWDLLSVGKKYLHDEQFVESSTYDQTFAMTAADQQIKQDTGYYRVFNQTVDPFNDAMTAYHHKTVGGYHPAKLQVYQDIIENQLSKGNMQVFNMLNTKYFIQQNPQDGKPVAALNSGAFGPAWLVKNVKVVPDAKAAMNALDHTNLRDTAIVEQAQAKSLVIPGADSTASIRLISNENDIINYTVESTTAQFAVLSEIYYPAGWKAFVDNKETEIIKTNYALRGVSVPAGKHAIVLKFEPASYKSGNTIALITSILIYIALVICTYLLWKRNKQAAV
jgi:hypothetical protein